jgi:hypothetical protein
VLGSAPTEGPGAGLPSVTEGPAGADGLGVDAGAGDPAVVAFWGRRTMFAGTALPAGELFRV